MLHCSIFPLSCLNISSGWFVYDEHVCACTGHTLHARHVLRHTAHYFLFVRPSVCVTFMNEVLISARTFQCFISIRAADWRGSRAGAAAGLVLQLLGSALLTNSPLMYHFPLHHVCSDFFDYRLLHCLQEAMDALFTIRLLS